MFRSFVCLSLFLPAVYAFGASEEAPAAFSVYCVNCHGEDGHGNSKAALKSAIPDLHSQTVQELSDSEMYDTIALGKKHREYPHAFLRRGLNEKEIHELVKYIRSMAPQKSAGKK